MKRKWGEKKEINKEIYDGRMNEKWIEWREIKGKWGEINRKWGENNSKWGEIKGKLGENNRKWGEKKSTGN